MKRTQLAFGKDEVVGKHYRLACPTSLQQPD